MWLNKGFSDGIDDIFKALKERKQPLVIVLQLLPFAAQQWYE